MARDCLEQPIVRGVIARIAVPCGLLTLVTPTLTQVYERSVAGRVVWFGLTYTVGATKKEPEPTFEEDTGGGR